MKGWGRWTKKQFRAALSRIARLSDARRDGDRTLGNHAASLRLPIKVSGGTAETKTVPPPLNCGMNSVKRRFRSFYKRPERVVYTCLFGFSERFLDLHYPEDNRTDFVCFTDDETLQSDFWSIVTVPKSLLDPHRRSKSFKHRPHLLFPNYESSLYIDNTVKLTAPPQKFFELLNASGAPMMMFDHPERQCIYAEAEIVKELQLDDERLIDSQMGYYRFLGYPSDNGLHATTVLLRKHGNKNLIQVMDEWHYQVLRFSKRDQLSFDVVKDFYKLELQTFDERLTANLLCKWPVVRDAKRLPRDFDDQAYLELNPDVASLGVNPRNHYLDFGIAQGRLYRAKSPNTSAPKFHVDPSDQRGQALLQSKDGQLNAPTFAMWTMLLEETNWTDIIDVGANYGEMLVSARFPSKARILAVEPNPRIFPHLQKNLHDAGVHCDCLPIAVSNQVGVAELSVDLRWSGLSSLEDSGSSNSPGKEKILVPVIPLDFLFAKGEELSNKEVIVKIDVEGHEVSVLEGAQTLVQQCARFAGLVEVLHLDSLARAWLLENFQVELYDLENKCLATVRPSTIEQFETLETQDKYYKNDVVIRGKRN